MRAQSAGDCCAYERWGRHLPPFRADWRMERGSLAAVIRSLQIFDVLGPKYLHDFLEDLFDFGWPSLPEGIDQSAMFLEILGAVVSGACRRFHQVACKKRRADRIERPFDRSVAGKPPDEPVKIEVGFQKLNKVAS